MKQWIAATAIVGAATLALTTGHAALGESNSVHQPLYACSIKVAPKMPDTQLSLLAKISAAQAQAAARTVVPGTIVKTSLESENDCLVYSVITRGSDAKLAEVKVDAGTGKVLRRENASGDNDRESSGENGESENGGEGKSKT